jgi:diguanylate cyclase (GGDEF)-like protein/PAS domain S-box-containing protein
MPDAAAPPSSPSQCSPAPLPAAPNALEAALRGALLDSRQRWRDLVDMLADIVWETDADGRFSFVSPDPALGWPADRLTGQPTAMLLGEAAFDPFRTVRPVRGIRTWVRRGDGVACCLAVAAVPLLDEAGQPCGARGIARDVTEEEERSAGVARLLRKEALIDSVLSATRSEVLADRMAQGAAEALMLALGAAGSAVLDISDSLATVAQVGRGAAAALPVAIAALRGRNDWSGETTGPLGLRVLLRAGPPQGVAIVLWRDAEARGWDDEDRALLDAVKPLIRVVLEHRRLQQRMTEAAQTDSLTGLLNRRAFSDEVARRIERLDHENKPAALIFCDLDRFKDVNDRLGHEAGDAALRAVAVLLRAAVRPSDLVARFGGDEFVLWLDGADEYIATDRAERLRQDAPIALAHLGAGPDRPLSISIGIAVRRAGSGETLRTLLGRADQAMYDVKRAGRAGWLVG